MGGPAVAGPCRSRADASRALATVDSRAAGYALRGDARQRSGTYCANAAFASFAISTSASFAARFSSSCAFFATAESLRALPYR